MVDFGITLTGDTSTILRFEQFPQAVHARLLATLNSIEQRLEAAVVAAEPVKQGQLVALTGGRVYDHGDRIAAVVGVRTKDQDSALKAMALEYGSHKALMVRAHEAKLTHLWGRAISPMMVQVAQHSRVPNIDPRRFLRDPAAAIRAEAIAEMRASLDQAVRDTE